MNKDTYKVLLIDDNKMITDDLYRVFDNSDDFLVTGTAGDGEEGFDLLISNKPDLVILDLIMPVLDGLGFLQKCSDLPISEKPVIMVLSAFYDDLAIKIASSSGANYYFVKPLAEEIFIQRLTQIMKMTSAQRNFSDSDESIKAGIAKILNEIAMPPHLKGYKYILDASFLVFNDFDLLSSATGFLYPKIAQMNDTESKRVERDIRNAIDVSWKRGKLKDAVESGFLTIPGKKTKPANVELIALITEKMRIVSNKSEQV